MPMKTKTKEIGKLVLIGLAMWLVLSTNAHAATTLTVCSASCSATTIGDAMDLAVDGDTISVLNGTYNEEVVLYNSVNLVGEDKNNVTISGARDCTEGGPIYNVVTILKASTNISGVTVTGGYNGITLGSHEFLGVEVTAAKIDDVIVEDNIIAGIVLDDSNENTVKNSYIWDNGIGIEMDNSSDNTIFNNYLDNDDNAIDNPGNNNWNTTITPGTNIVGGLNISGNYWTDYTGSDTDANYLGDTLVPHTSSGGIEVGGDYNPLVKESLQDKLDNTGAGGTLNINERYEECVNINRDITLVCGENAEIICEDGTAITFTGDGGHAEGCDVEGDGEEPGVSFCSVSDSSFTDGTVDGSPVGIYVEDSEDVEIGGSTVSTTGSIGFSASGGRRLNIHDNDFSGNQTGISLVNSDNNIIERNILDFCDYGIKLGGKRGSDLNTIADNTADKTYATSLWINSKSVGNTYTLNFYCTASDGVYLNDNTFVANTQQCTL
jgi:parallel beta-helix repeat protein